MADLVGSDIASLWVIDENEPGFTVLMSTSGVGPDLGGVLQRAVTERG